MQTMPDTLRDPWTTKESMDAGSGLTQGKSHFHGPFADVSRAQTEQAGEQ